MKRILLALTMLAAVVTGARATSIFADNFDYTPGSLVTNSAGNWGSISPASITSANMLVTTNSMILINGNHAEDVEHFFPTLYMTNGPVTALYSSYTLKVAGALPSPAGAYISHFSGTNVFAGVAGFRCRVWLSLSNATHTALPDGKVWLAISASNLGSTNDGVLIDTNVTYMVVTRYVVGSGQSTMWLNPSSESDTSITSTEVLPNEGQTIPTITNGILNISSYGFRQNSGEGLEDQVDNFRVGTTFNDVAGPDTAPTITGIANQSIAMNAVAGPLSFTIGDDGGVGGLSLTSASSNTGLIITNNIVFGGSGASRTVTLTPNTGVQGVSTITITVSDGVNQTSINFLLTVGAPTITTPANLMTYSNLPPVSTTVTVGDAESGAAGVSVSNSWSSVNQSLISSINVTGSGATRTVTITPAVDQTGLATITLYARDPQFNLVQTSFKVTVSPKLGVLYSDTFSYNDWSFTDPQALEGATGSSWVDASGTHNEMQVTNGYVIITSSNTEDMAIGLGVTPVSFDPTNGAVLYASFTVNPQSLSTPLGDYFAHFRDTVSGTTFRAKIYSCHTNSVGDSLVADNAVRIGIANAANTPSVVYPLDVPTNTTVTVVVKLNAATGESWLWVSPLDESSPSVSAKDTTSGTTVGAFGLRESDFEGTLLFDNLKIGTEFTDVFTPIPQSSLQISLSGGVATVTWANAGTFFLQSATNVLGPFKYTTNAGAPATSPYTVAPTAPSQFYRAINVAP